MAQDYRYEASGGLSGLMRVRGFCMNDAHIYCRYDQAKEEFIRVMHLHARYYDLMNIKEYYMRLVAARPGQARQICRPAGEMARRAGDHHAGDEGIRLSAMSKAKGEAAFYGPKIDFMIKSVIGTEYTISTNQLDFLATQTFDLNYIGEDGADHPVYVIHRAPLGTHERFTAFLIEHYAGAFPVWLAPIQARVIPISEKVSDYAQKVLDALFDAPVVNGTAGLRVDIDTSNERMQKKIRDAQLQKIPYMLVVGEREAAEGKVAVRLRSGKDLGAMPLETFIARIKNEAESRLECGGIALAKLARSSILARAGLPTQAALARHCNPCRAPYPKGSRLRP